MMADNFNITIWLIATVILAVASGFGLLVTALKASDYEPGKYTLLLLSIPCFLIAAKMILYTPAIAETKMYTPTELNRIGNTYTAEIVSETYVTTLQKEANVRTVKNVLGQPMSSRAIVLVPSETEILVQKESNRDSAQTVLVKSEW